MARLRSMARIAATLLFSAVFALPAILAFQMGLDEEPLLDYRRRLGIEFNYTTKSIHPEICRYLSQEECIEKDNHARRLQSGIQWTGTLRAVVILLKTTDFGTPPREDFETLFNGDSIDEDITPTGSIKEYFKQNSYGQLDVEFTITDWVESAFPESYCVGDTRGVGEQFVECFEPGMQFLDDRNNDPNDPFDWFDYDSNGDFFIDFVIVIHNGYASENGGIDPNGKASSDRIRSYASFASNGFRSLIHRGGAFCTASAFRGFENENFLRLNVATHEFIHLSGMFDLYDLNFAGNGCGTFCLMAYPTGQGNRPVNPGNIGAFTKEFLEWVEPIEITQDGLYQIGPSFTTGEIYRLQPENYDPLEYLLIENRQAVGWDAQFWLGGGIVIWHVNNNDVGIFSSTNQVQVRIIQADGLLDLENRVNFGDGGDLWIEGREVNDSGVANIRSVVNDSPTGVRIFDFSPTQPNAQFRIEGLAEASPTEAPAPTEAPIPATQPSDPTPAPVTTTQPPDPTPAPIPVTSPPAPGPTTAPVPDSAPAPIFDPGQCALSVGTGRCDDLLQTIDPETTCDCYNFCDGSYAGCCEYGVGCPLSCGGEVTAGCVFAPEEPSEAPTVQPVSGDACLVSVSTDDCPSLMPTAEVRDGCDCYNFCNGVELPCCEEGTVCPFLVCAGDFVAGCRVEDLPATDPPVSDPICYVQINTASCGPVMANRDPVPGCDCYDFCNGEFVGCCPYDTFCGFECATNVETVVAGCQFDDDDSVAPPTRAPAPTGVSRPRDPFFFWPEGLSTPRYNEDDKRRLLGEEHRTRRRSSSSSSHRQDL